MRSVIIKLHPSFSNISFEGKQKLFISLQWKCISHFEVNSRRSLIAFVAQFLVLWDRWRRVRRKRLSIGYCRSWIIGRKVFLGYSVISFHGQIVPSQIVPQNSQFVPQKSQFVPHMLYLFSKCVNVIRVQTSDRNMDFRTIYIMLRAPYVNFTMHCGTMWELFTQWRELMFVGLICLSLTTIQKIE